MASIAVHRGRDLVPAELRRLIAGVSLDVLGTGRAGRVRASGDLLTARSLASVGVAALLSLPLLILVSLPLGIPVAAPAVLALGYLAVAHALASRRARRAALWSTAIFGALAGWTLLFGLAGGDLRSWAGLTTVLLAPAFAAAPAFARYLLAERPRPVERSTQERVACLDQFAPSEAVLFVDAQGKVLAATRAGLGVLGMDGDARGTDITRVFQSADGHLLQDALARSHAIRDGRELVLRTAEGAAGQADDRLTASIAPGPDGSAALRLCSVVLPEPNSCGPTPAPSVGATVPGGDEPASCDLQEAISFALRLIGPKAQASAVTLICEGDSEALATCDVRTGRRIAQTLLGAAVAHCGGGGAVRIAARNLRGVVLLRVSTHPRRGDPADVLQLGRAMDVAALAELVDRGGGSMLVERSAEAVTVSVRLVSAAPRMAQREHVERSGAA